MTDNDPEVPEISLRATQRARDLVGQLLPYFDDSLSQADHHEVRSLIEDFAATEEARTAEEVEVYKKGSGYVDELAKQKRVEAFNSLTTTAAILGDLVGMLAKTGIDKQGVIFQELGSLKRQIDLARALIGGQI